MSTAKVRIKTGPHGHATELYINDEKVENAYKVELDIPVDGAVTMTVGYINLEVEIDADLETTALGSLHRQYKRMKLVPMEEGEE